MRYGLTRHYGFTRITLVWNWPEPNFGSATIDHDQPFSFYYCRSNDRLFAVEAFGPAPWYPDTELLWVFYRRLRTPEGLNHGQRLPQWATVYGQPLKVLTDLEQGWPRHVLPGGLLINQREDRAWVSGIGVYDTRICQGDSIRGAYLSGLGRVEPGKVQFSRTGDVRTATIGDPLPGDIPEVRSNELLYVLLELTFPPARQEAGVLIRRKITTSSGETIVDSDHFRAIKQGETRLAITFEIGWRPRRGEYWTIEFFVSGVFLGKRTFRNSI